MPTLHLNDLAFLNQASDAEVNEWADVRVPANGGSVSASTKAAATAFMIKLKSNNLRSKVYRLNLFAGNDFVHGNNADMGAVQVPLIIDRGGPIDVNNAATLTWNYAERGSSGGLQTSGSAFLKSGLIPSVDYSSNDSGHVSVYVRTSLNEQSFAVGGQKFSSPFTTLGISAGSYNDGNIYAYAHDGDNNAAFNDSLGVGHYMVSRTDTSNKQEYKNGIQRSNAASTATALTDLEVYLFAFHASVPAVSSFCTKTLAGYSMGLGFTSTEALIFYNAWQDFQTALNRQV